MKLTEQFKSRLKKLAGLTNQDSKSQERRPKPQLSQPPGSIVGCMNENASNYNPAATVACTAGDADWFADNPQIQPGSFPNECCEYDCENPMQFVSFGGTCSEEWMATYCDEGSSWPGVGLATSFVTMCNACPCNSIEPSSNYTCTPCEGCQPSSSGPFSSLEECEGTCSETNIDTFFDGCPGPQCGGFNNVDEFCNRCEVEYEATQQWASQNNLPNCDCC